MAVNLIPPLSKSDAHRAMVLADVLGVSFEKVLPGDEVLPTDVEVLRDGLIALRAAGSIIDCQDGGAPFRFLLAQAAVLPGRHVQFMGTERLGERPHAPLVAALRNALADRGLRISEGTPWPLIVQSPEQLRGPFAFHVTGVQSSQYASALLLSAARLARASGEVISLTIDGSLISEGYFALTRSWLQRCGFSVGGDETEMFVSAPRTEAVIPPIPGDWSSIGYLLVLSWRSGLSVARMQRGTGHPDEQIATHLERAGFIVDDALRGLPLRGLEVDAERCPDAIPTLAALATRLPHPSRFLNTHVLTLKESDRRAAMLELLGRAGIEARLEGETLVVQPGRVTTPIHFDARDDHRMAMTAAVLSHLHEQPLFLRGAESVSKSFPGFWAEAAKVNVRPR